MGSSLVSAARKPHWGLLVGGVSLDAGVGFAKSSACKSGRSTAGTEFVHPTRTGSRGEARRKGPRLIWMGRTALRLSWASPGDVRLLKIVGRVLHWR
jgi:hypothetical protein